MSKDDYLNDEHVDGLVGYFSALIRNNEFQHGYTIRNGGRNAAWINYNNSQIWECNSIQNAREQYFWLNGGFDINNRLLADHSGQLRDAINREDETRMLCVCLQILEWGGVTNGAHGVAKAYCNGRLIQSIRDALAALTPGDMDQIDLDGFANGAFIMNASYTKIYSLLSDQPFIIYDSRVAAALSLIVKLYWLGARRNNENLPDSLCLACLDGRGNNALIRCADDIANGIRFKRANNDREHALWNMRANWIIEAALIRAYPNQIDMINRMREIEAALFMIGYSV